MGVNYLDVLAEEIATNSTNKGFWDDSPNDLQIPRKLALIHAETSEALEEHRANGITEEFTEELADIIIRVLDLAGHYELFVGDKVATKHIKNKNRPYRHNKRY